MAIWIAQKWSAIWINQVNLFLIKPIQLFDMLSYFNTSFQRLLHSKVKSYLDCMKFGLFFEDILEREIKASVQNCRSTYLR